MAEKRERKTVAQIDAECRDWLRDKARLDRIRRAAPDLLEACEAIRDWLESAEIDVDCRDDGSTRALLTIVSAAIAKARGES